MLKTLVINGAVKEQGECRRLIEIFAEGTDAEVIDLFPLDITPCKDCGKCRKGSCVIDDYMTGLYEEIERAEIIVFASPIYYSSMTGVMMNFLSRLQLYYLSGKKLAPKKAGLLLTGGGATKRLDLIEHQLRLVLRIINAEYVGLAAYIDTDRESVVMSPEIRQDVSRLKEKLFSL